MRWPALRELPEQLRLFAKYHLTRQPARGPEPEEDLGVALLGFDLDAHYRELDAAHCSRREQLAEVAYAGGRYPIHALYAGDDAARARLMVLCGVHGNEHAGLLAAPRLLAEVAANTPDYGDLALCVVSPVNPVGAAHRSRYNGDGRDINRDFARFDTIEARAVRDAYRRFAPSCVVSLHEGPQQGTFVFGNACVEPALASALTADLARAGAELASHDYFGRELAPAGYAGQGPVTRALLLLWRLTLGMASSGEMTALDGVPELTVETPWRSADADERTATQLAAVRSVARYVSRKR